MKFKTYPKVRVFTFRMIISSLFPFLHSIFKIFHKNVGLSSQFQEIVSSGD